MAEGEDVGEDVGVLGEEWVEEGGGAGGLEGGFGEG